MSGTATRAESDGEGRRSDRHKTFLGATIVHGDDMLAMACSVRDWSEHGARLEVPPLPVLPATFWLLDRRSAVAFAARVIWRREGFLGVEFTDRQDLEGVTKPRMVILRNIWLENAPRAWSVR